MKGYTENSIIILGDIEKIFEITNTLELWTQLFTEYKSVDIIEKETNYIKFRLTMFKDKNGKEKSWISERYIEQENYKATAKRLEPLYPFKYMNITWTYDELPQNIGVNMTWIQEFEVDDKCPIDVYNMESYLNKSSRIQMKSVKESVEKMLDSYLDKSEKNGMES